MDMEAAYKRIDAHCHFFTDTYRRILADHGIDAPDGVPMPQWSVESQLEAMELNGVAHSVLSISSPHPNFGGNGVTVDVRRINEEAAEYVRANPEKLSFMASLPLPNAERAIDEVVHCLDKLGAKGFTMPTNVRGVYLGNPALNPLMEVLNERRAVVSIHPTAPSAIPENVMEELPAPMIEFFFDTSRAVINLLIKGTFAEYPDISWIVPHAGAVIPVLSDRLAGYGSEELDVYGTLGRLYYDLAGPCTSKQLGILLKLTGPENLLFGSDFPFTNVVRGAGLLANLEGAPELGHDDRMKMFQQNPEKLFGPLV